MPTVTSQHQSRIEAALASGQAARSPIAASWARSAHLHGLDPVKRRVEPRLTAQEIALVRERMGGLVAAAAPHLDWLFQTIGGLGACVVLADAEGIAVERRGNPSEDRDFAASGLWTGAVWSEAEAGTNGIGTCLAEGRAVTIHRDQHFLARNIGLTCTSAPVHDANGQLAAVIDVSTAEQDVSAAVLSLISQTVQNTAQKVEADLFHAAFPKARVVLVPGGGSHSLAALVAVNEDDLVIGATRGARALLGLAADPAAHPRPLADLLGLPVHERLEDAERAVLHRALARASGNVSAASRALGLSRATLHRKLAKE